MRTFAAAALSSAAFAISQKEAAQYGAGLVTGLISDLNVSTIEGCFQGGSGVVQDVENAYKDFKHANYLQGAQDLGAILQDLPQELSTCKDIQSDLSRLESWASIFTNPIKLGTTVGVNVLKHSGDLMSAFTEERQDFKSGDYVAAGQALAKIFTSLVGPVPDASNEMYGMSATEVPEFVAGLIFGFTGDEQLNYIQTCLNNGQDLVNDIEKTFNDFKGNNYLNGISDIGALVTAFPTALQNCQNIQSDLNSIESWAKIFGEPVKFAETAGANLIGHFGDVSSDVNSAMSDFNSGNFYQAGQDVAKVLTAVLGPINNNSFGASIGVADVPKFLAGLVFGFVKKDNLSQIETCYTDGENLLGDVELAFNDLKGGKYVDGVAALAKVVEESMGDLKDCKNIQGDVQAIENWGKIFEEPKELVETLVKNFFQNEQAIKDLIKSEGDDFSSGNYYQAGADISSLLIEAVGPVNATQ